MPSRILIDASLPDPAPDRPDGGRDLATADADVAASPPDAGIVHMLVARPERERRVVVDEAMLDEAEGMVGDDWLARGSRSRPDGSANPEAQLTLMSVRVLAAIEPDESRWPLAGDQLLVDLDLSVANLPPGTRLVAGEATLVVSATPHTGCAKFSARFGSDALRWINGETGRAARYRGVNARVARGGIVRRGDAIRKA